MMTTFSTSKTRIDTMEKFETTSIPTKRKITDLHSEKVNLTYDLFLNKEQVLMARTIIHQWSIFPLDLSQIIAEYMSDLRRFSLEDLICKENAFFAGLEDEPELCGMQMADLWEKLGVHNPTQLVIDRLDITKPHDTFFPLKDSKTLFVSTDIGFISVISTCAKPGQYHVSPLNVYNYYPEGVEAPSNVGGFHYCVIETHKPNSTWNICTRLIHSNYSRDGIDYDMGVRVKTAYLVQDGYKDFIASPHKEEDECRTLLKMDSFTTLTGRICFGLSHGYSRPKCKCGVKHLENIINIPSGLGDGYYGVEIQDSSKGIE